MYPISLSIKGLYSYKQKCVIPFDKLARAGIFGIFGKVGSGKSSILEAITFALYGQSDRLNQSGDNRNYNMMNLGSNEIEVQFEFLAGTTNEHFLCEFRGTRNTKNFENVKTYTRKAAKKVGTQWQPVELKEVEQAIGLSYDNFRRTVIIPQGKFAEFLQLTDAPRIAMIKDIFNLHEFDLQSKSSALFSKTKNETEQLRHLLESKYAYLTKSFLEEKVQRLKTIEQLLQEIEQELTQKQTQVHALAQLKTIFEELHLQTQELERLEAKKQTMQARELFLERYIQVKNEFEEWLSRYDEKTNQLHENNQKIDETQVQLQQTKGALQKINDQLAQLVQQQNQLNTQKNWIEPLKSLLKLRSLEKQKKELQQRHKKGLLLTQQQQSKIAQLREEINAIEQKNLKLKATRIDTHQILEAELWYKTHENLSQTYQDLEKEHQVERQVLEQLEKTCAQHRQQVALVEKENYEKQIRQITQKIEVLTLQKGLEQAVEYIHQGNACPVCGSEVHPNLLNLSNIARELEDAKQQRKQLEKQREHQHELMLKLTAMNEKRLEKMKFLEAIFQKQQQAEKALAAHQHTFVWDKTWTKDKINNLSKEQQLLTKTIEQNENKKSELQNNIEAAQRTLDAYQKRLNEIDIDLATIAGEIKSFSTNLDLLPKEAMLKSDDELQEQIKTIEESITELDNKISQFLRKQQEEQQLMTALDSRLKVYQDAQQTLINQQRESEKIINEKLNHFALQSKEEVENILSRRLDTDKERKELTNFFNQLEQAQKEVRKLRAQTNGQIFDAGFFENLQGQLKELRAKQKQVSEEKGAIQSQLAQAKNDQKAKEELEKKLNVLDNRLQNLSTLASLFKGQGFVNFASTDYLHNLCQLANARFSKLTNHSMELLLNEKNEFVVRDFLDEGKQRHIKTLSGGQLFQASLSMALALSESMRKQQQFFFLDEGFGSLDNDSLQIVLETLKNLQTEHKTVGIISHVESLRQEIDTHILIEKTPSEGSIVKISC